MSNLMASFNAGVSGLHSAQASLNTTSHNLANAQTKGYVRQQVLVMDSFYQSAIGPHDNVMQVGTGTVIAKTRQIRNTFLDSQYRLQLGRQCFYEQNQSAAMELEDMLGELEGEQFQESITEFQSALSSLSENPENIVFKDQVVSIASKFIERARALQNQLNTYQTSLNTEVINQVDRINEIITEIKDYNQLIRKYEATGDGANDYRDKRNDLLDELGQYINFDANEEVDGVVTIYAEGSFLLDSSTQYFLTTAYESDTSKLLKPVWATGGDFFRRDSLAYSTANNTDVGFLWGLLVARGSYAAIYNDMPVKPLESDEKYTAGGTFDQRAYDRDMDQYKKDVEVYNGVVGASIVMSVQNQLDMLVHGIVTKINNMLCPNKEVTIQTTDAAGNTVTETVAVLDEENALMGDDKDNTMGTELFSRRSVERYTKMTAQVRQDDGTYKEMEIYKYNEEDPSDIYSLYTIGQLEMNPVVLKDASTLAVKYSLTNGHAQGYAYDEVEKLAGIFDEKIGVLNPNSMNTYNSKDFYVGMVDELANTGFVWNGIVENQQITASSIDDERQNVMGVSTEEELSDLIKFQRCFDASSRYITTISEMLEYIIERLGG